MLSTSPQKTADVVLGNRPNIACDSYNTHKDDFVEELLAQISTICSIYHKTPDEMVKLHGIAASTGMFNRATASKIALGQQATLEAKNKPPKSKEEKKTSKSKEEKPKAKKEKSGKMDDDSSSEEEVGKKKPKQTKKAVTMDDDSSEED